MPASVGRRSFVTRDNGDDESSENSSHSGCLDGKERPSAVVNQEKRHAIFNLELSHARLVRRVELGSDYAASQKPCWP